MRIRTSVLILLDAAGFIVAANWTPSSAQQGGGKSKTKSLKSLDARVEKLEATMLREIVEISNQYEEAGQHARAKALLEVLLKLNPDFPGLKEKLDLLNEKVFDAQEIEFILDASKGWTPVQAAVVKGKAVRVDVEGEYSFEYVGDLTADGIMAEKAGPDFVDNIPCGGLMAMIVKDGKPGKPAHLKSKMQWNPADDGLVLLRINAPAGHKSTGKLTVKLSGLVSPN